MDLLLNMCRSHAFTLNAMERMDACMNNPSTCTDAPQVRMPEQDCTTVPVGIAVELVCEVRQVDVEWEGVEGEGPVRHAQGGRRRAHRDARH